MSSKPIVHSPDLGILFLRLSLGILMLLHGIGKLQGGVDGISGMLAAKGMPGFIAYGVYLGEVIAPIFIVIGLWTRPAALVFAINMVIATLLAHSNDMFALGKTGGLTRELNYLYFFGALALVFLGSGKFSVSRGKGRFD
jgi:putative oxidoreductase